MEAFYALATEDYRQLALAADWRPLLVDRAHEGWSLLDVACGSGKFPTALLRHADLSGRARRRLRPARPLGVLGPEARGALAPAVRGPSRAR